ncbi:MAG: hypothetical protein ACNA78_09885 [Balneolaceae bacterium]
MIGLLALYGGDSLAQGFAINSSPLAEQSEVSDPFTPANGTEKGDWSIVYIGTFVVLETVFLAGSFLTRYKAGSYTVGGLQGIYAVTAGIGALAGFAEYGITPGLILVGGLGYLSYYNFAFQGRHSNTRKFWTNFAGMNAAVGLALAASLIETQFIDYSIGSVNVMANLQRVGIQWVF